MSSAFVGEGDDQWLHDIAPSADALVNFLTRENGGLRISIKKIDTDGTHTEVYHMSDGFRYTVIDNKWQCLD